MSIKGVGRRTWNSLERHSHSKVEREVALEAWMCDRVVAVVVGIGGMDSLHAGIEPQNEVVEVETKAESVRDGYLSPKLIEAELPARLVLVVADGPDVARIDEGRSVQLPEEMGAILHVEVELDVARLVDEVNLSVGTLKAAGTKLADTPATHAVGTAAEVALFVRQNVGVAVGNSDAEGCMQRQRVVLVDEKTLAESHIELGILCVSDFEKRVLPLVVPLGVDCAGNAIEQVASRFDAESQRVGIRAVVGGRFAQRSGVVGEMVAPVHDEEVFVVVLQDGVAVLRVAEILLAEGVAYPRHEHVVEIQEVEAVLHQFVLVRPTVTKHARQHAAVELGAVLRVESEIDLGGRLRVAPEGGAKEGNFEVGEGETRLDAVLDEVLVGIATQTLDGLESTAELDVEQFRTSEEIAVLIGESQGSTEVAGRVGALHFCAEGVALIGSQRHFYVERVAFVSPWYDSHIGGQDGAKACHAGISLVHVAFSVKLSAQDGCSVSQHLRAQEGVYGANRAYGANGAYWANGKQIVADVADVESMVREVGAVGVLLGMPDNHFHVRLMLVAGGVNAEVDVVFVELVVAVLNEKAVEPAAFRLQRVDAIRLSLHVSVVLPVSLSVREGTVAEAVERVAEGFVLHVEGEVTHMVAFVRNDVVDDLHVLLLRFFLQKDFGIQVAIVADAELHVVASLF